jgi:hypothetical protein
MLLLFQVNNIGLDSFDWITPVSVITAAIIAGLSAMWQIKSNKITSARLEWLQNLKSLISTYIKSSVIISKYLTQIDSMNEMMKEAENKSMNLEGDKEIDKMLRRRITEDRIVAVEKLIESHSLIILNLNPKEDAHNRFVILLNNHLNRVNWLSANPPGKEPSASWKSQYDSFNQYQTALLNFSQLILKLEWEKAKRNWISYIWWQNCKGIKLQCEANCYPLPL